MNEINSPLLITTKKFMDFLSQFPEIFSDLVQDSILNIAIYKSFKDLEVGAPINIFHVLRTEGGIEIHPFKVEDADLELAFSLNAIEKLIKVDNKNSYLLLFGKLYNEPDEEFGWIDFILHKRIATLIEKGYGKFAIKAGILEDDWMDK